MEIYMNHRNVRFKHVTATLCGECGRDFRNDKDVAYWKEGDQESMELHRSCMFSLIKRYKKKEEGPHDT